MYETGSVVMDVLVKVVVPVYTTALNEYEKISLDRLYSVLGRYPIVVVKPRSLDISELQSRYPKLSEESFDDGYFRSVGDYNRLMLSAGFYERFSDCRYILICQLDAYVFRDELAGWCEAGYDYIGAPWLVRPVYRFPLLRLTSFIKKQYCSLLNKPNGQVTNFKVGNGGFSLRRVESHLKAVRALGPVIERYLSVRHHVFNEDVFFAVEVNRQGMGFAYPDYMEALRFGFDKYPALCYKLNGNRLPFGCHSWYKRKMKSFWFPVILKDRSEKC